MKTPVIKIYNIKNLPWNPYRKQFYDLLTIHRGHQTPINAFIAENPRAKLCMLLINNKLVAMLRLYYESFKQYNIELGQKYICINMVIVDPQWRKKGLGGMLINAICRKFPKN